MPNPAPRKPFNLMLSREEYDMMQRLTESEHCSGGHVLRTALRAMAAHVLSSVPTCATGSPCYVPQMHRQHVPQQPVYPPLPAAPSDEVRR